ncbi:MAG: vWA domain-containing protein [Patescibacteria group bacterium]|jgi:hypothetical protein
MDISAINRPLTIKQIITVLILIAVIAVAVATLALPNLLSQKKNLSLVNSRAVARIALPPETDICTAEFNIPTPPAPPSITPTPTLTCNNLDIAIVTDRSDTMTYPADGIPGHTTKLEYAKAAMTTLVNTVIGSSTTNVKIAVADFGRQGDVNDPVLGNLTQFPIVNYVSILETPLSNQFASIVLPAISAIHHNQSGTCIQCGLHIANRELTSTTNRKVVILLSDGMANRIWTGVKPGDPDQRISKDAAIAQATQGRANGIEYKVIGYGEGTGALTGISEDTLKRIACADPNDAACVANNYAHRPNALDWSNAFLAILRQLCQ